MFVFLSDVCGRDGFYYIVTMKDHSQSAQTEIHTFNLVRQAVVTLEDTGKHNLDFIILPPYPPVLRLQKR